MGLGKAIAIELAQRGAKVVVADVDREASKSTVAEIEAAGGTALAADCDVRDRQQVRSAIELAQTSFGPLRVMVNNAAVQRATPLPEVETAEAELQIDVNLKGTFFGCQEAVSAIREHGAGGSIVNVGSILSLAGDDHVPVYTMTKHAMLGLSKAVAVGYGKDGVRCNCVCPGDMHTPMIEAYWGANDDPSEARRRMEALYPRGSIGETQEVARVVAFVASDAASFVTGAAIPADGGLLARAPS